MKGGKKMTEKVKNGNTSFLLLTDPLDRLLKMGKKINYSVNYKKELAKALDEKYRNIYWREYNYWIYCYSWFVRFQILACSGNFSRRIYKKIWVNHKNWGVRKIINFFDIFCGYFREMGNNRRFHQSYRSVLERAFGQRLL